MDIFYKKQHFQNSFLYIFVFTIPLGFLFSERDLKVEDENLISVYLSVNKSPEI